MIDPDWINAHEKQGGVGTPLALKQQGMRRRSCAKVRKVSANTRNARYKVEQYVSFGGMWEICKEHCMRLLFNDGNLRFWGR